MGQQWLTGIVELLTGAGIRAGEAWPGGIAPELLSPAASVGLTGLDCGKGQAAITVTVLSPRRQGGWSCQTTAAKAVCTLANAGYTARMGQMEYLAESDCFRIAVEVTVDLRLVDGNWEPGQCWEVLAGDTALSWVTEFTAEQDRGRRIIRDVCQTDPGRITPGSGGWSIRLTRQIPQGSTETEMPEEPFALTVSDGRQVRVYSGCCWNGVRRSCGQAGMTVEHWGFALSREVTDIG